MLDTARLEGILADNPETDKRERDALLEGWFGVTSAYLAARFFSAIEGNNSLS